MVVLAGPVLVCLGSAEMHKRYPATPPTQGRQAAMLPKLTHAIAAVVRFHADRSAPFFPNAASDRARAHFAEGQSPWPTHQPLIRAGPRAQARARGDRGFRIKNREEWPGRHRSATKQQRAKEKAWRRTSNR